MYISEDDSEIESNPEGASSNPTGVNIFQLTSAVLDYLKKFLFTCISEDDSEMELKHCTSSHG